MTAALPITRRDLADEEVLLLSHGLTAGNWANIEDHVHPTVLRRAQGQTRPTERARIIHRRGREARAPGPRT